MKALRAACATVAARASQVRIDDAAIPAYATALAREPAVFAPDDEVAGESEERAAFWLTLDAINFGSGWFPTLRKPAGLSGYRTISEAVKRRFGARGPWRAEELAAVDRHELGALLGQDPDHPLIELFARSLRALGAQTETEAAGSFAAVARSTNGSAVELALKLGGWPAFADRSRYQELTVPFLKRAQIAAADLARARVIDAPDLDQLTMFADNLVPHVLRLDGILRFDADLVARIDRQELLDHGSPEEVEIRACAVHAVELIVAAADGACAAEVDQQLWWKGQRQRYKASPRHRCRCTAY